MKQTLQLKLGQQLTMTPQLQQAIRLLQLSSLELQAEIQEILETNPLLENSEENEHIKGDNSHENPDHAQSQREETVLANDLNRTQLDTAEGSVNNSERDTDAPPSDIPSELSVDSSWEDTYDTYSPGTRTADSDNRAYENTAHTGNSLNEHLLWQMELTPFSDIEVTIAMQIIDAIDEHGYLSAPLEDIHQTIIDQADPEIELDEIEAVLTRIQYFDPPGIGARDLCESMRIQLNYLDADTPWLKEAKLIVSNHFNLLANREYNLLMRRMKLSESNLQETVLLLKSLNPRPGNKISDQQAEYVIPDVFIRKEKDRWKVELNPDVTPKLSINSLYAHLAQGNNRDSAYMKNHLQEARWFLKSLRSRNDTLLKVATCIVERQQDFLEFGDEAMKPLVMHDVAEVVNMHESTISRVTTKKYMHTPKGIFELKYFFSSHVSTANGGECSATAIRAMLRKLIAAELRNKPLSDNKLASLLAEKGINVARRTVAKYREAMSIPPSNERKRLV
ncbi:MAG: RNA polymerase factor sigma-54 [Thiohalomonadales bacterium]